MVEDAIQQMETEGFTRDQIDVQRTADIRFHGQAYELTVAMPARELKAEDAEEIFDNFLAMYERTYGEGTAWKGVPASLINYSVTVTGQQDRPDFGKASADPASTDLTRDTRRVFLPTERRWEDLPIIDDESMTVGSRVEGPAIIDAVDTTIYVPPGTTAERDEYMNYVLTR